MGLENRAYFRDGSYTDRISGLGLDFTPMVKYLIVANVIVFLLQIFFVRPTTELPEAFRREFDRQQAEMEKAQTAVGKDEKGASDPQKQEEVRRARDRAMEQIIANLPRTSVVQKWCELDPDKTAKQGQVWRLLTCAFCHDRLAIWHVLFNMVLLYWFGTRLETMYGSREFLLFYLTAALAASVAYVALALYTGSNVPAIGASGAVMGVMMLYTIFYPWETIRLFWFFPVPIWILLSMYVLFDLHPVLLALAGDQMFTGVAHAGHLGGLAFGFLYWKLGLRLEAPFERDDRPRKLVSRKPQPLEEPVILASPMRDVLNEQLDAVLQKISEMGQGSLTEEERDILMRASAKYRQQR